MNGSTKTICAAAVLAAFSSGLAADDRPVALIIAQGGLGDESWNDSAHAGFMAGLEATGGEGRAIESKDVVAQGEELMRRAADAGFGLVISLEWAHGEPMESIAGDYPDVGWVIMNQVREGANITSVVFGEHEGSFLAGALSAMVTTDTSIPGINDDPVIGVIGGRKSVGIDKFIVGFIQGANAVNPDVEVKVAYANAFGDPAKGQQMAQAMFEDGADIIYQVAGGTGIGIIEAAKGAGRYAIGVDTDQDGLAPGNVLTSVLKRVDVAVEDVVKRYGSGDFAGGNVIMYGLVENGVGLSAMTHTKDVIPASYLSAVEEMRAAIIAGDIDVWDTSVSGYPEFFN